MKKNILIIVFFALFNGNFSFSQEVKLGFELNPGFSWCKENSKVFNNQFARFAIEAGLVLEKYFTNNYAFYSGIKLVNYGFKLLFLENSTLIVNASTENIQAGEKVNFKLQYLNIPLGIKMKTNRIGYFSYFINLGLNPYFNIKSIALSNFFENESVSKEINFFNISYYLSLGIEYNLVGETNLLFGIKYNNGFFDVMNKKTSHETLNNFMFTTGIIF